MEWNSDAGVWLALEGVLPLFGPALLYLFLGLVALLIWPDRKYRWAEAFEPLAWLYGGTVVAAMTAVKAFKGSLPNIWVGSTAGVAVVCLLIVVIAMQAKAADEAWKPASTMSWVSGILCVLILGAGYQVHAQLPTEARNAKGPQAATEAKDVPPSAPSRR